MCRHFTPSVHSANLLVIPHSPSTIIRKAAPGPPLLTAMATPAMLPNPTVPDTAEASAWKCVVSPGSSPFEYRPRTVFNASGNADRFNEAEMEGQAPPLSRS